MSERSDESTGMAAGTATVAILACNGNDGMVYAVIGVVCARQPVSTGCKLLVGQLCCCCLTSSYLHPSTSSTFYLYETRCDSERSNP